MINKMTSPTMIQKFLYKVNLPNLIKLFEDEQIDYDILGYMSKNDFDDIVLRFSDKDQGQQIFYNCLFKWSGNSYVYHSVEVIEGLGWGGPVKKDLKDSISIEVFKDIQKNKMIF